jgi:uncharacterized repeat protein (TIGR01451 family)
MKRRISLSTAPTKTVGRNRKRNLAMDRLESRQVLATYTVTSTVADLTATTSGSLNWAIVQANADQTPDKIIFSDALTVNNGLITVDAKWLRRVTSPIEFNGLELPNGSSRSTAQVVLNGPKNIPPGYNIGPSILDFTSGGSNSIVSGLNFLNNGGAAITVSNADNVLISGNFFGQSSTAALRGPNGSGVVLVNANSNKIQNNSFLFNTGAAITVSGTDNQITGNNISNNGAGIVVTGTGVGNTISANSIYLNSGTGIDVAQTANNGILAPNLTQVTIRTSSFGFGPSTITINGELSGQAPNTPYRVQFFTTPANSVLSPQNSQGRYYFQSYDLNVTTDGSGYASFSRSINSTLAALLGAPVSLGDYVTATVTENSSGNSSGFSNSQLVERQRTADLGISIKADPNPVQVGDIIEYTVNVNNSGPDAASNVLVTDQLDPSFIFVDAATTQGTVTVDNNNKLVADLGQVDAVRSVQVKFRVRATQTGLIGTTVDVTTPTFDTDPLNDSASVNVQVNPAPRADLSLDGDFQPPVASLGSDAVYTIKVTNNGPDIARTVTLKTNIGDFVSFVSATTSHGTVTYDPTTRILYANLGSVEAAGNTIVSIVVHADQIGTSTFTATAETTSVETAPSTNTISSDLTIVDIPGKIQFPKMSYTVQEDVTPVNALIQINRVQGTLGEASVLFSTRDGSAIAGIDYVGITDQLVTFPAGDTSPQYVNVQILPTAEWFLEKSFQVVLTDATGAELGSPTAATVHIIDSQPAPVGTIQLVSVTPNPVNETGGSVTVQVERIDGVSKALAINYSTANGTALAGVNYTTTTGTLTWAEGETGLKSFKIPVLADGTYSPSLNFQVNLAAANADTTITGPTSETVTILNMTQKSDVAFNPVTYQVLESAGIVTLSVSRTALPLDQGGTGTIPAISVNYATANGTAVADVDYTAASGTLTWAAGDVSTKTIIVGILDNSQISLDRSFTVNLTGSSPNFAITESTATVVIKNNDVDNDGPVVSSMQLAGGTANSFNQLVLNFNEALDPTTATNLNNYTVQNVNTGATVAVTSVQYLAGSHAVLVNLASNATRSNVFYAIYVNADSPTGVQDVYGNMMNGNGNGNGSTFVNTMVRGTSVFYNDNMANRVTVSLQGGYFDMTRYQNGSGRDLAVFNTTRASVLSGSVRKLNASSSGYTRFDTLSGVGVPYSFRVTMTTPPFYFNTVLANNPPLPTGATPTVAKLSAKMMSARRLRTRG